MSVEISDDSEGSGEGAVRETANLSIQRIISEWCYPQVDSQPHTSTCSVADFVLQLFKCFLGPFLWRENSCWQNGHSQEFVETGSTCLSAVRRRLSFVGIVGEGSDDVVLRPLSHYAYVTTVH